MRTSKLASGAALVGGLGWLAKVLLIWGNGGQNTDSGLVAVFYFVGLLGLAVALLAGGYSTVVTAPVWLRAVVSVASLALGWIIFTSIDSAARGAYSGDGWLDDELGVLISAGIALVAGTIGMARTRTRTRTAGPARRPSGGHRAMR